MPADVTVFSGSRSGPQFGRRNLRRKTTSLLNEVQVDVDNLASFKSKPSCTPEDFRSCRPYVGRCCRCMPISREDMQEVSSEDLGMRNILDVNRQLKLENAWATQFSKVVYMMRRPLFGPFPDLSMAVLTNRRVVEAIQKAARELDSRSGTTDKLAIVEKRAARIMKKMKASISSVFIKTKHRTEKNSNEQGGWNVQNRVFEKERQPYS